MTKSIIFFDIDGTILSEKTGIISDNTKNAIKAARDAGHLTFINTGRTIAELNDTIYSVGFDGYVCGCGTYINLHDKVLYNTTLDNSICKELVADVRTYKIDAIMEATDFLYYEDDDKIFSDEVRRIKQYQIDKILFPYRPLSSSDITFDKFTLWLNPESDLDSFYKKHSKNFTFIDRNNGLYEIIPNNHSKATGIEYLLKHLNIPLSNAYAIGDSTNDLSMLNYVTNSIAMGNSDAELLPLVSFVTKDVDENGIEYALSHFNLI